MSILRRSASILKRLPEGLPLIGTEIGVRLARNARVLLRHRPGLHLNLIDPWALQPPESLYAKSKDKLLRIGQAAWEQEYSIAMAKLGFARKRITVHRMLSEAAAPLIEDHSQDFVFIDADHSYEGCKLDIELYTCKVKSGGWIGGHDYTCWRNGKQRCNWNVSQAVHEAFNAKSIELDVGDTWFVRL